MSPTAMIVSGIIMIFASGLFTGYMLKSTIDAINEFFHILERH